MITVATLHVRDVPHDVYEALRQRAERNGRSINAEALDILGRVAERERETLSIIERLEALAREINLPPDAPKPEDLIREDRDSR